VLDLVSPWPEVSPPPGVDARALCGLVSGAPRLVWAEGNALAPCAVVLDNPGAREDRQGHPQVCGTRQTLRLALEGAGLHPSEVHLLFLYKCRPLRAYDRIAANAAFLPILREQVRASPACVLVGLGNTVAQALLGPHTEVRTMRGRWLRWCGRPLRLGYHPLAARRRPQLLPLLVADLAEAARVLVTSGGPSPPPR
jgi:uracil-DNA glycosylase family 4